MRLRNLQAQGQVKALHKIPGWRGSARTITDADVGQGVGLLFGHWPDYQGWILGGITEPLHRGSCGRKSFCTELPEDQDMIMLLLFKEEVKIT